VYSVNEEVGTNQIIGIFTFEAVCSLEYGHKMNIQHDELTWPTCLQHELQKDNCAKLSAAQRGDDGNPRPLQTRTVMLGDLEKIHDQQTSVAELKSARCESMQIGYIFVMFIMSVLGCEYVNVSAMVVYTCQMFGSARGVCVRVCVFFCM